MSDGFSFMFISIQMLPFSISNVMSTLLLLIYIYMCTGKMTKRGKYVNICFEMRATSEETTVKSVKIET